MLDGYIIDALREEQERRERERGEARPRLHIPPPAPVDPPIGDPEPAADDDGFVIIPLEPNVVPRDESDAA